MPRVVLAHVQENNTVKINLLRIAEDESSTATDAQTGVNDLCRSSECVRLSAFPHCRVSPVDQVTLGANCLSLGAQGWAALIVLWPGTRCSY